MQSIENIYFKMSKNNFTTLSERTLLQNKVTFLNFLQLFYVEP